MDESAEGAVSAILMLDWSDGPPNLPLSGFILAGEAPPLPEMPAA